MKAIETAYNGFRFRSRLEARWAVFFDTMMIEYEYEPEGFDLGEAGYYLPDFWLPRYRYWIEIKPNTELTQNEQEKVAAFAKSLHTYYLEQQLGREELLRHRFFLCCGNPYLDNYCFFPDGENDQSHTWIWTQCPLCNTVDVRVSPDLNWDEEYLYCENCDWNTRHTRDNALTWFRKGDVVTKLVGYAISSIALMQAYTAARQARFEHRQIGAPTRWK